MDNEMFMDELIQLNPGQEKIFADFIADNPALRPLEEAVLGALNLLRETYDEGGKVLICGNGGSAADAEHIVGELMKGFLKRRPLDEVERAMIEETPDMPEGFADKLQGGLPAFALNTHLPRDIRVLYSNEAPADFHARFSAKEKTYEYTYLFSATDLPLFTRYAAHVNVKVDISRMQNAIKTLLGTHDFKAFCASGSSVKDTVRTVSAAEVAFLPFTKNGGEGLLKIKVTGNGFLYNMVRIIAGTLLEIGQGKREEKAFTTAIETGSRKALGKTAPAKGLTLVSVKYQ